MTPGAIFMYLESLSFTDISGLHAKILCIYCLNRGDRQNVYNRLKLVSGFPASWMGLEICLMVFQQMECSDIGFLIQIVFREKEGRFLFFQGEKVAYYSLTWLMFPLISECCCGRITTELLWECWWLWKLLLCNALNESKTLGKFLFLYPLWFPGSSEASCCLIHTKSTIFFDYYKCNPLMLKRFVHVISKYITYNDFGIWTKITTSNPFRNLKG